MAPKNKFTKEEMVTAAMRVVREGGVGALTAKTLAAALGASTQPIFTAFGSMDGVRQAVYDAAVRVYDGYTDAGLREKIPFFGVGMQYIRFAREEPELYRLLFLTQDAAVSAMRAMAHLQEAERPTLMRIYRDRRLPVFRPRDRADPHGLQRQHRQVHQGNSRLRVGRF